MQLKKPKPKNKNLILTKFNLKNKCKFLKCIVPDFKQF